MTVLAVLTLSLVEASPVFTGGVMVLRSVFDGLGIENMIVSTEALREGMLFDLLGRVQHETTRRNTIEHLVKRYEVDQEQAQQVEQTAIQLLAQVKSDWLLEKESCEYFLRWAASVHEIGLSIAHSQHHKHAAYILSNYDMYGFSRQEKKPFCP